MPIMNTLSSLPEQTGKQTRTRIESNSLENILHLGFVKTRNGLDQTEINLVACALPYNQLANVCDVSCSFSIVNQKIKIAYCRRLFRKLQK